MIRTLEVAWLCITIISFGLTIFQFFKEGIKFEQKDEKELYH